MSKFYRNIVGRKDPHIYQDFEVGVEVITNSNLHYTISIAGAQTSPAVDYKNGYSVFGFMGNVENNHASYMYLFNHRLNKVTQAYNWGNYVGGDYHSCPVVLFLPDGRILMNTESVHNEQMVVKRSLRPFDITEFEDVAVVNGTMAYNNMVLSGERIYIICRTGMLIALSVYYSDDFGTTWTEQKEICSTGTTGYWPYPKPLYPHGTNDICFFWSIFDHVANDGCSAIGYMKLRDGHIVLNADESYQRDINVQSLSLSDMHTYFKIKDLVPHEYMIVAAALWKAQPYYILQKPSDWAVLEFGYFDVDRVWKIREIAIAGENLRRCYRLELLPTGDDSFILYTVSYTGSLPITSSRVVKITTSDAFQTFTHEFITDGSDADFTIGAAHNFADTQKTAVITQVLKERGTGDLLEPIGGYSHFKIVDKL